MFKDLYLKDRFSLAHSLVFQKKVTTFYTQKFKCFSYFLIDTSLVSRISSNKRDQEYEELEDEDFLFRESEKGFG